MNRSRFHRAGSWNAMWIIDELISRHDGTKTKLAIHKLRVSVNIFARYTCSLLLQIKRDKRRARKSVGKAHQISLRYSRRARTRFVDRVERREKFRVSKFVGEHVDYPFFNLHMFSLRSSIRHEIELEI